MPRIEIKKLTKKYGDVTAVHDLDLLIKDATLTVLLGPSGCGKTTVLRCVAGLEKPDAGEILLDDEVLTSVEKNLMVPPEKRNIGMVFQSYALWPHMTVFENVVYPIKVRKLFQSEIGKRVNDVLKLVRLEGLEDRYPSQLSGGQQQRVALARSIASEPKVLLLDEPLSNLDAKLRAQTRLELKLLQRRLRTTSIYVTHDQLEAMEISDEVVIMNRGKIMQMGSPYDTYRNPKNEFVADFIGSTNLIHARVIERNSASGFCVLEWAQGTIHAAISEAAEEGKPAVVSMRNEDINIYKEMPKGKENIWRGKVESKSFLGDRVMYHILVGEQEFKIATSTLLDVQTEEYVYIQVNRENCLPVFPTIG